LFGSILQYANNISQYAICQEKYVPCFQSLASAGGDCLLNIRKTVARTAYL
jgi:hypothetical protein